MITKLLAFGQKMRGICFKEPLFYATIEGRKTMTRRIINPQPNNIRSFSRSFFKETPMPYELSKKTWTPEPAYHFLMYDGTYIYPRYRLGEILYLKEPYNDGCMGSYIYKFGHENEKQLTRIYGWRNKLFMPAKAARYFIRITGVRAERLQDISVEDCIKEGITFDCAYEKGLKCHAEHALYYREYYAELIDEINGKGTWMSDPFVWVYDYELIK